MTEKGSARSMAADFARLQWTIPNRPARLPSWMTEVPVLVEIPFGAGA